jgi:flagellar biosynthetic protein FlhB
MSREQDLDRNEKATPHKLEEARKRGQTARSTDLMALAALAVAMLACFSLLLPTLKKLATLLAQGLAQPAAAAGDPSAAMRLLGAGMQQGLLMLAPLLLGIVVAVVAASLLQSGGLVVSTTPIKPDFNRLNPVQGLKRFFSLRLLYEALKSTLKLAALVAVTALALQGLLMQALQLLNLQPPALLRQLDGNAGGLMAKLCAVLLLFLLVDLMFTRWDFLRNLRMSRRELEDEHKNREGDPRLKSRLRELRLQYLERSRAVSRVPQAQLVVTNPTHIAVALKYEHGLTPAPLLLAKGAGQLAAQIRLKAQQAGVPIVHSPRLARALFKEVAQDAYVPEHWYPSVARILVWLRARQDLALRLREQRA